MSFKWFGAILIVAGCAGTGLSISVYHKRDQRFLKQMLTVLEFMECELQCRLTHLPELCRLAAAEISGPMHTVLLMFCRELDWQISPDVCGCMVSAIRKSSDLSPRLRKLMLQLGRTLGRFDLPGQTEGIKTLKAACELELKMLNENADNRLRSYQTLWLCTGAALVILFL